MYKGQGEDKGEDVAKSVGLNGGDVRKGALDLSPIHISEPTRKAEISDAVFCLKKKNKI